MHVSGQSSKPGNNDISKLNNFILSLPKANQIFQMLQHAKKSIYPFDMITNSHQPMPKDQQPYNPTSQKSSTNFRPVLDSVGAHFQQHLLIYDKFNNNRDEQLFNENIYPIQKLKTLKNIDYLPQVEYTKSFHKHHPLTFNSRFESGNLSLVSHMDNTHYLLLHNDVNTSGYTNWFYFQVKAQNKGRYRFAILNYGKAGIMHNLGVKICVYQNGNKWVRGGQAIWCQSNARIFRKGGFLKFNTLYFQYEFGEDQAEVYFAYNVPYTYNNLCCFLTKIQDQNLPYFHRKLAGLSLAGNRLQMLTITNFSLLNSGLDLPIIILMGRSHPGQTVSSWIMHQFISFIISNQQDAVTLRNNFVFKLFPMINPDGVIHGNYRCSLSGRDLNRRWNQNNKELFPEVYYIRNQIVQLSKRKTIKMILDFHGHTKRKKIFAYGCNNKNQPHRCRLFPYILSKLTNYFEYKFCNFNISKYKFGTARISLFNQLKIPYIYTIETSQFGTYEGHLSLKVFNEVAVSLAKAFFQLFRIRRNDRECEKGKGIDYFQKFQTELINDGSLLRVGADRDSGSESEPSVDNIKYDRLAQLTKRKELKLGQFKSNRIVNPPERLNKSQSPLMNIQMIQKSAPIRPKTSDTKRYEEMPKKKPTIFQKRIANTSRATERIRASSKHEGPIQSKSVPSRRKGESLNFINLSLSVFDDDSHSTKKTFRTGPSIEENFSTFNERLFNKLRSGRRNYFQFRRLK